MLKEKETQKCKTKSTWNQFYNHLPPSFYNLQHNYGSTFHSYTVVCEVDQDETYSRVSTLSIKLLLFFFRYLF